MGGTEIETAIAALAKDFAEAGRILDVDRAAFGLSLAYPDSSLTTEEIRLLIIAAADHWGIAILAEAAGGKGRGAPAAAGRPASPRRTLRSAPRLRRGTSGRADVASRLSPRN